MTFASPYDEACFRLGPAAIFTLDPRGHLRVDPERTREIYLVQPEFTPCGPGFYVLTDRATGLQMLMVVTHSALAELQPRAAWKSFATYALAAENLRQRGD